MERSGNTKTAVKPERDQLTEEWRKVKYDLKGSDWKMSAAFME